MRFESKEEAADYFWHNPNLTEFYLEDCGIASLPALPNSLGLMRVDNCPRLTNLPNLPGSLRSLTVKDCAAISALPVLPNSLTRLSVEGCPQLTQLPELPPGLRNLWLINCAALTSVPALPTSLSESFFDEYHRLLNRLGFSKELLGPIYIKDCPGIFTWDEDRFKPYLEATWNGASDKEALEAAGLF